jgi:preprotein translocase subunit SecA
LKAIEERYKFLFNLDFEYPANVQREAQNLFDLVKAPAREAYLARVVEQDAKLQALARLSENEESPLVIRISRVEEKPLNFNTVEQDTVLETLDHLWNTHLQDMDHLREGIGLRGYGQKNPLYEYQKEGFELFQQLIVAVKEQVIRKLFYHEVPAPQELIAHLEAERQRREAMSKEMQLIHGAQAGEGEGEEEEESASPDDQKARMSAQKKARRKVSRR